MIFYKSMIAGAMEIARAEKDDNGLSCVLFEADGSIAAVNQWAIYAAEPTNAKIIKSLPFPSVPFESACAVSINQLAGLVRAIPADKQFKGMLEHVFVEQDGQFLNCEFNDGKSIVKQRLRCSKIVKPLGEWKARLKDLGALDGSAGVFVYNRARLVSVVNAIEAACKYPGEFAFVRKERFARGEIWRSTNELSGQTVIVAHVMPTAASLPTPSDWDRAIFKQKIILRKK